MATYHCSIKKGKTGVGKNHCDYITREGKYSLGEKKEELVYKECGNLPEWAESANDFFDQADLYERANGNVYYEFEIALPNELTKEQNIKMVQDFVNEHIGKNKIYCFAIHDKKAALDDFQNQPHAHIMFSERVADSEKPVYLYFKRYNKKCPERGGHRKDDRFTASTEIGKKNILKIRESWEKYLNSAYEKNNLDITVSAKSLKDQKDIALLKGDRITYEELDRPAQLHLGPKITFQTKREQKENKKQGKPFFDCLSEKACLTFIAREIAKTKQEIADCKREISKAEQLKNNYIQYANERKKEVDNKVYNVYGHEFLKCILEAKTTLRNDIKLNNETIKATQKMILSYDRIKLISESVYTKGMSKKLNSEKRKLANQREKFEQAFTDFSKMPLPKMFDSSYKKQYNDTKEKLDRWQTELLVKEKLVNTKLEFLFQKLGTKEAQEQLKKIQKVLLEKNEIRDLKITELKRINVELKIAGREFIKIQNELFKQGITIYPSNKKFKIYQSSYKAIKSKESSNITQPIIKDLQTAVYNAKEGRTQGGFSANIKENNDDKKYDNDYDR